MSSRASGLGVPVPVLALALQVPAASAWSGGPLHNVTELDAKCAVCHSSVGKEQSRLESPGLAAALDVQNRHYKPIEEGTGACQAMSAEDRQRVFRSLDGGATWELVGKGLPAVRCVVLG